MRQRWWIAVVAVVGIALAVLMFPRPDTGEAVRVASTPGTVAAGVRADGRKPGVVEPTRMIPGPRPEAAEVLARRATPEATTANLLVGPVSSFKYVMLKTVGANAESPALETRIDAVVAELRAVRIDPAARPWSEVEASVEGLVTAMSESSYGSNAEMQRSIARARSLMAAYHEEPAAAEASAPSGTATPTQENE